jgi:hypothetical protein
VLVDVDAVADFVPVDVAVDPPLPSVTPLRPDTN